MQTKYKVIERDKHNNNKQQQTREMSIKNN